MSHNPKSTKRGEAWPSSSSESVTNRDAEKIKDAEKEGKRSEKRPDEWNEPWGGRVTNETNYRREKKEKREGGVAGLNKNSIGRMCCNEEEINRKEEAEMKREDVGTKDESCWGVVIHTLVSF